MNIQDEEELTPIEKEWGALLHSHSVGTCLKPWELLTLAKAKDLACLPSEQQPWMEHVLFCETCQNALPKMREADQRESNLPVLRIFGLTWQLSKQKFTRHLLAGGAIACVCSIGLIVYTRAHFHALQMQAELAQLRSDSKLQKEEIDRSRQAIAVQSEVLHHSEEALQDSQIVIQQDRQQLAQNAKSLVEARHELEIARRAEHTVRLSNGTQLAMNLPAKNVHDLQSSPSQVRGNGTDGEEVTLVSPVGEYSEIQPLFRWKPFPHAVRYNLKVYEAGSPTFVLNQSIDQPENAGQMLLWEAPPTLRRGAKYQWQVTAEFKKDDAQDAQTVTSALAIFKTPTLTQMLQFAVQHANAGMVTQAHRELEAVLHDDPHNRDAQTLLKTLKQLLRKG